MGKIGSVVHTLLIVMLVAGLLLTGCVKPAPTVTPAPTLARIPFEQQQLPKFIVAYASPGGSAQIRIAGWASIMGKYTPMKGSVTLVAALKNAIELARAGRVDFWTLSPPQPWAAYSGEYEAEGIKKLRLRHMTSEDGSYPGVHGVWVLAKSDIKEGKDLKGKKIGTVADVPHYKQIVDGIIKAHAWTDKDYTYVPYALEKVGFEDLVEKKINAFCCTAGTASLEVNKTVGLLHLPLTKQESAAILEINPSMTAGMSTPDYMGAGPSHWAMNTYSSVWCRADLNEKTTYTMVKTLFEHLDEFHAITARAKSLKLKTACDLVWTVPYHPGVIRYYQEMRVWNPEYTERQRKAIERERKLYGDVPDEEAFKKLGILP